MAKKRYINTKFWSDDFIISLKPLERYFFLYLLTNEHTDICGIYELSLKVMTRETDLTEKEIIDILRVLEAKIAYIDGWVSIKNFEKHQAVNPKVIEGIKRSKESIPNEIMAQLSKKNIGYDRLSKPTNNSHSHSHSHSNIATSSHKKKKTMKTIHLDEYGEPIKEKRKISIPKGFIAQIAHHYMRLFNIPITNGIYFGYKPTIEGMIKLSQEVHGENYELIKSEIYARIDIAHKKAQKENWGKMKLSTILENWNVILNTWSKEIEL